MFWKKVQTTAAVATVMVVGAGVPVSMKLMAATASPPRQAQGFAGQSWPQWRGPNRDGVVLNSPKLMDEWPKEGPPLLWKSGVIPSTSADTGGKLANEGGSGSPQQPGNDPTFHPRRKY